MFSIMKTIVVFYILSGLFSLIWQQNLTNSCYYDFHINWYFCSFNSAKYLSIPPEKPRKNRWYSKPGYNYIFGQTCLWPKTKHNQKSQFYFPVSGINLSKNLINYSTNIFGFFFNKSFSAKAKKNIQGHYKIMIFHISHVKEIGISFHQL